MIRNRIIKKFERKTSVFVNPGFSIFRLVLVKIRVLLEFYFKRIINFKNRKLALTHNRKIVVLKDKIAALVLGNGPSLAILDVKKVIELQVQETIDVYAVNQFLNSAEFHQGLIPNFLVLSDPVDKPIHNQFECKCILQPFRNNKLLDRTKLLIPQSWYRNFYDSHPDLLTQCIFFDDTGLEGWSRNTKPNKARGYLHFTAFKALAFACSMDYEQIAICGIDNTMFKGLRVDSNNKVWQYPNHHIGTSEGNVDVTEIYPNGVADYFHMVSLLFLTLKKFFSKFPIVNLDQESLVDCFQKSRLLVGHNLVKD